MTTAQQGIQDADHERSPLLNGGSYNADIGITGSHNGRTDGIATVDDGNGVNRETRDKVAFGFAALGLLIIVVTTWSIILSHNPSQLSWFAYHPTLQTVAISLFILGIMTLQPTSKANLTEKRHGLVRHQIFNFALAFPIILVGAAFIFYNKAIHRAPHFTTWHSTFGLISITWILLQVLVGAGSVWFDGKAFGGGDRARAVYKYHRLSGYLLLICLLYTIHLGGAWSTWVVMSATHTQRFLAYTVAPLIILAAVFSRMRTSKMPIRPLSQ